MGNLTPAFVVNDWLKSPLRSTSVGTDLTLKRGSWLRVPSNDTKKNVFCLPLYNFGIRTGPPNVPPYSLKCTGGLSPPTRLVWKRFALRILFWLNSKRAPWYSLV